MTCIHYDVKNYDAIVVMLGKTLDYSQHKTLNFTTELPFDFMGIFVYRMSRLCGGAHEISGIKAPLFLHGGVVRWGRLWRGG